MWRASCVSVSAVRHVQVALQLLTAYAILDQLLVLPRLRPRQDPLHRIHELRGRRCLVALLPVALTAAMLRAPGLRHLPHPIDPTIRVVVPLAMGVDAWLRMLVGCLRKIQLHIIVVV